MSGNKKSYDLIFSIGEACSCSISLRNAGLQNYSYPLDWLFGSDFIGRCQLLSDKFNNFIDKDDLEFVYSERSAKCEAYHNKKNDLTFNHDFIIGIPFEEIYPEVLSKYKRRINRLLNKISCAKRTLIVYIEAPTKDHIEVSNDEIRRGYSIITQGFAKNKFDMLYISYKNGDKYIEKLGNCITRVNLDYKDYDSEFDYQPLVSTLTLELSDYELNISFKEVIKRKLLKLAISLIPNKQKRKDLRNRYHVK